MYNSDHTATECIGQNKKKFLLPPQSVDVLSRFIYTAVCPAHYTQKIVEKGFKIAFMMNKLAMIISFEIILEK